MVLDLGFLNPPSTPPPALGLSSDFARSREKKAGEGCGNRRGLGEPLCLSESTEQSGKFKEKAHEGNATEAK